ncbi:hypothetical protein [Phenylobacterium sp.]|jgi:hypothetical protein|uniref:hypothetical protein n=1 Tax=Phenylobacterium sp. TaxID=1871053 RepID=UPI002F423373
MGVSGAYDLGAWSDGLAEWVDGDTAFLSVAFTWKLDEAYARALWHRAAGRKVRVGGPGVFTRKHYLADVAEIGGSIPDALVRHNPMATKASEGCPVGCFFCIVPAMEGREFTLLPEFVPRPVLTDNNLSALPAEYQQFIVDRYVGAGVPLLDANSGFEPKTFDEEVFERWRPINRGPWRFGSDEALERADVERVLGMLRQRGVGARRIQVYTMIGHEPFDVCMERLRHVIEHGGEPYVQPIMKLNALRKEPWVRHDWTPLKLRQVQRWANRHIWRTSPFEDYRASEKSRGAPIDDLQGSFAL